MRTSRNTLLHEPRGAETVPQKTFAYFRVRNKHRLFSLVIGEFKRSGLSQADLARRLGRGTDTVCRWLRSPTNWEADTVSDLLFAISGAEAAYSVKYPLRAVIDGQASVDQSETSIDDWSTLQFYEAGVPDDDAEPIVDTGFKLRAA